MTGNTRFEFWGLAAIIGFLLLAFQALFTSERLAQFDWLLPVRRRRAHYLCNTLLLLLWVVFVALVLAPLLVVF